MTGDRLLAKTDRLLSASDFSRLRAGSTVFKYKYCMVIVQANALTHSRLGLAASKKSGNAVKRNLLKRVAREFFRLSSVRNLKVDILIVPSPALKPLARDLCAQNFRQDLFVAFSNIVKLFQN